MREQGMKAKKQIISLLFLLVIMAVTFWTFCKGISFSELLGAFKNADYSYLIAGLGMMLLFVVCEAINIKIILKVLGQPVSFFRCCEYSSLGFYFSSITPSASGGQPAQVYYMKRDQIPLTVSSLTIFYIVFVYQIAMILLGAAAFVFRYATAVMFISKLKYLLLCGTIINTGAIFLFFLLMFSSKTALGLLTFFVNVGSKLGLIKQKAKVKLKLENSVLAYHEKAIMIKQHPILFAQVLIITIIQMIALSLIPYLVYKSMGYHGNNMISLIACQALLTISVSAIPLPGAEGISQLGFVRVFDMFFPHNAITYAMLINRALSFYLPLVISFVMYIFTHVRSTKQFSNKASIEE